MNLSKMLADNLYSTGIVIVINSIRIPSATGTATATIKKKSETISSRVNSSLDCVNADALLTVSPAHKQTTRPDKQFAGEHEK